MEQGSAPEAPDDFVEDENPPCSCGYKPRARDRHWIHEFEVWHVICYGCGKEWVE